MPDRRCAAARPTCRDIETGHVAYYEYLPETWHRMRKTVDGEAAYFVYDADDDLTEHGPDLVTVARYVTPFLDDNLLMSRGGLYYYHKDALGSIRELTDAQQDVKNLYDYLAYGDQRGEPTQMIPSPHRFTGRPWEAEVRCIDHRWRKAYSGLGRFLARDPGGEVSPLMALYTYADGSPTLGVDPLGLATTNGGVPQPDLKPAAMKFGKKSLEAATKIAAGLRDIHHAFATTEQEMIAVLGANELRNFYKTIVIAGPPGGPEARQRVLKSINEIIAENGTKGAKFERALRTLKVLKQGLTVYEMFRCLNGMKESGTRIERAAKLLLRRPTSEALLNCMELCDAVFDGLTKAPGHFGEFFRFAQVYGCYLGPCCGLS